MEKSSILLIGTIGVLGIGGYMFLRSKNQAVGNAINSSGLYVSPSPSTQYPWQVPQAPRMDNQNQPWAAGPRPYSQSTNDLMTGANTTAAVASAGSSLSDLWDSLFSNNQDLSANYNLDQASNDFQMAGDGNTGAPDGGYGFTQDDAGDGSDYFGSVA